MAYLSIASATGFRVRPEEMAAAILSVPGFELRRIEREGKRQRGAPREVIERTLRSDDRDVLLDFIGRKPDNWGHLSATKNRVGTLSEVDLLVVNVEAPPSEALVASFVTLCEAACAEFGCLDERDPFPGFKWYWDIPLGLPGLAWTMWFGPQLASCLPPGALERCWPVAERRSAGHLMMLSRSPLGHDKAVREAVAACLGKEVFAPRRSPWPLDTSAKNTIVPEWVKKGVPPELPPGMRIVAVLPGRQPGSDDPNDSGSGRE